MEIKCNKCGIINDYRTVEKSNNRVAYCNGCDSYIKNIPYDSPKLYVGKYKGIPIKEIDDLNYLKWAIKTLTISESVRSAITSQISHLEFLAK